MKKLILLLVLACAVPAYAQTNNGNAGGAMPSKIGAVGGKDSNGKLQPFSTTTGGVLNVQGAGADITRGAPTDRSGTITTGGISQTLAAALSTRTYIEIQNISDETMYINFGAAATVDSNSFKIVAGGSYINPPNFCPTGTITIIGATTGKKFVAKEG